MKILNLIPDRRWFRRVPIESAAALPESIVNFAVRLYVGHPPQRLRSELLCVVVRLASHREFDRTING
jgi:hypothetical protein